METNYTDTDEPSKLNKCKIYALELIKKRVPILVWLPTYDWKSNLVADFFAGFTLAVVNIPQSLAFAILANVPLIYGLYTACFTAFVYTIFGTATVSSFGPVAVGSMLCGEAIAILTAPESQKVKASVEDYAATLTFAIGIFYLLLFFLRFGSIIAIFRKPFISGYIVGCTSHIMSKSFKMIFGLRVKSHYGSYNFFYNLKTLVTNLKYTNVPTLIISSIVLPILVFNQVYLKKFIARYTKFIIPVEAILLIFATILSYIFSFNKHYGVPVVGVIPTGFPDIHPPVFSLIYDTIPYAVTIGVINFSTTISMTILFNEGLRADQESLAMSIANMICCNFQCITIGNSMMRTVVAVNLGIKSLLATMISSLFLLFVILFAGPLFESLPECILGCVIISSTAQLWLKNVLTLPSHFKSSFENGFIWIACFLTTIIFEIEKGLIVGVVLSLRQILGEVMSREDEQKKKAKIVSAEGEVQALPEHEKLLLETNSTSKV